MIPQNLTEQVLLDRLTELGGAVHRPYVASGLRQSADGAEVTLESGEVIKAQYVVDGLAALGDVIDRLAAYGLIMSVPDDGGAKPLEGQTYVVSGSVPGYSRTSVNERIEALAAIEAAL